MTTATIVIVAILMSIPPADMKILSEVADEYKLTGDARRLLFNIRVLEDGGPGRECGVLTPAAMRYKGDHAKSLRLQAKWAAGTIRKRFTGDITAFGERWAPTKGDKLTERERLLNRNWVPAMKQLMKVR